MCSTHHISDIYDFEKLQNSSVQYLSTTFSISVSKLFFSRRVGGGRGKDKTLALFTAYLSINQNGIVYSLKDRSKAWYQGLKSVEQGFQSWGAVVRG